MDAVLRYIGCLIFFCLSYFYKVQAQLKYKAEFYSTQDGLSHDAVTNIIKDREGFIWIGTWSGINRFDGHTFKSFKSAPGDLSRLKNDRIDQIVEDHSNNFWIKAYDNQVYRFDKRREEFHPFEVKKGSQKIKILFDRIKLLKNGEIWLITASDGVVVIPDANKQEHFLHLSATASDPIVLPSGKINFLFEDSRARIWLATDKGMMAIIRSSKGKYSTLKLSQVFFDKQSFKSATETSSHLYFATNHGEIISYDKSDGSVSRTKVSDYSINQFLASNKNKVVYACTDGGELIQVNETNGNLTYKRFTVAERLLSIFQDKTGNLWIEPEGNGVLKFNHLTGLFTKFTQISDGGYSYNGNHYKVFEDKKGRVWVNMKSGGFGYVEAGGNTFQPFSSVTGLSSSPYSNVVTSLYYQENGVLWFSTVDRGINKVILQDNTFGQKLLGDRPHPKSDNEVRGIWVDRKQRVWVGVKSRNLYILKNGNKLPVTFLNQPKGGIGAVYCIMEDSNGNIWLGTKASGLYLAQPVNGEQTAYKLTNYSKGTDKNGLNSNEIYALLEDRYGKIWVGTFDQGLSIAVLNNGKFHFRNKENGLRGYPVQGYQKIRSLALDLSGNVWIGTTDGLIVKSPGNALTSGKSFANYSKIPGAKSSLGNNDVQYVFRDSRNTMWLATSGGGLEKAIGSKPLQNLHFRNYTTKDGLPSDYILSCTEDVHGYLWAATQNGLSRFEPLKERFRNFDSYDGLPKATFSEAAAQRFNDGTLIYGTNQGYIYFHPDSVVHEPYPSGIAFTNLMVNNIDQHPEKGGILSVDINYLKNLRLKYDQNIISIDYTLLDSRLGPKQTYAYRLSGFETEWNNNGDLRRATYTNLPPGDYTFQVKSLNSDSLQAVPLRSLEIKILPPPWRTWWAYLLYAITFILLLEVARRIITSFLRLRNKIVVEQKLAEVKSSFFMNISHELRTPLTLILNPIEEIKRNETLTPQGLGQIEIVKKNSNRMVRFINQLLDLRKMESGKATLRISKFDVFLFVREIFGYFTELAIKKNISLDIQSDLQKLVIWADVEKLDIVLYNLLSNAFKFSPDNKTITVIISINDKNNTISIIVKDQGRGVAQDQLKDIFKLYYQVNNKFDSYQIGSGIGLALSKELMELHQGEIQATLNADEGLSVELLLPLGLEHLSGNNVQLLDVQDGPVEEIKQETLPEVPIATYESISLGKIEGTVLLVEDNQELKDFLFVQLSKMYKVETADNGQQGWEKAKKLIPDLILSDVMMPVMNGIELLDKLKNDILTSHIPVVMLTAKYSVEDQIEGLKYGADYYITKPFNNNFLFAAISGLINQRKQLFSKLLDNREFINAEPTPIVITDKDKVFMEKVIEIVERNMENPEFNIDSVADTLGMARSTFYRKFKSLTNIAPVEFVREMRLKRAKQYLDAGETRISDIAYTVGFNNAKYFSTCFREKYQYSPSEYLRSISNKI